jgi:hypothetical protein
MILGIREITPVPLQHLNKTLHAIFILEYGIWKNNVGFP